ncbi:hypothetical protein J0910_07180 [Nocardiopsis sp. CNT-189]|uniref:polymorphic toxin-type HINT domain-containing protein n=1 Tax=Nocardiopsis oceanisediminis TaxID=2816862 RepID=UPI003B2FF371
MRWVWRAEAGGFKVEYAALVLLIATLVTAVFAFGLPTDVQRLYAIGLCRIAGDEACEEVEGGGADQGSPGEEESGNPGGPDGGAPGEEGAEPSAGPSASPGEGGENGEDWVNPADAILAQYDPVAAQEYADAESDLADAQQDLEDADYDAVYDELINLVGDIIGYNDAKACLTEGDIMACLWTVVGFTPWGKGAKLVKNSAKIIKLWNRFRKAKKAKEAAEKAVSTAQAKLDDLVSKVTSSCKISSFLPCTEVLMADGGTKAISQVEVGDLVMSEDPVTGERAPQPVTAVIGSYGDKELVSLGFRDWSGGITGVGGLTATGGHPFWIEDEQRWKEARDLVPGDEVTGPDGSRSWVTSTSTELRPQQVNNLSVANFHTYYVWTGSGAALVHNCKLKELNGPGRPFQTPKGLIFRDRYYNDTGQNQHALQHVLEHSSDNSPKAIDRMKNGRPHTKFKQDGNALQTLNDAWGKRKKKDVRKSTHNGKTTFWIPMGKAVGDDGEEIVKIVVEKGNEVVTAFPVKKMGD